MTKKGWECCYGDGKEVGKILTEPVIANYENDELPANATLRGLLRFSTRQWTDLVFFRLRSS